MAVCVRTGLPWRPGVDIGGGPGDCPADPWQDTVIRAGSMDTEVSRDMTGQRPWPWPETMDALTAAPSSHRVLLDNDQVRVLEVVIEPGTREPEHTHRAVSVMIVDEPARIRYYQGDELLFDSGDQPASAPGPRVSWLEPEGPHSVENIDRHRYHAIRIELR